MTDTKYPDSVPSSPNDYKGGNDFRLKKLVLTTHTGEQFDLKNVFGSVNIYQDLFANTISADLTLIDASNLKSNLPILGHYETVDIEYETPGFGVLTYRFFTYAIPQRSVSSLGRSQTYTIKLVSPESYYNLRKQVGKSFSGPTDAMIGTVFSNYLSDGSKQLIINSPTISNERRFVIPYWHPFYTINWLCARSLSSENINACNYLFFERSNAESGRTEFVLSTIEKLIKQPTKKSYTYRQPRLRKEFRGSRDINYEFSNITAIEFLEEGDRLSEIMSGRFSGTILTHDIITQKHQETTLKYQEEFKKTSHVEKFYPISDSQREWFSGFFDANYMYLPKHSFLHDGITDNDYHELWSLKRKSLLKSILSKKVAIEVPGDSSVTVGDIVYLDIPRIQAINKDTEDLDPTDSGRYLVIEVMHRINPLGYTTTMKLVRDSLPEPVATASIGETNA